MTKTPIQRAIEDVCDLMLEDGIDGFTLGRVLRVLKSIESDEADAPSGYVPRPAPPNVETIVEEWLRANGYDGLCIPGECGCSVDDFMPCGCCSEGECIAGYKGPPGPEGGDWAIYWSREAAAEAEARNQETHHDSQRSD